jgi:hypothetical protein
MLNSIAKPLNKILIPHFEGEVAMFPFDLSDLNTVPKQHRDIVKQMIQKLPNKKGTAFLTVHGKFVKKSETLRRGAPHIDGNYISFTEGWDNPPPSNPTWNTEPSLNGGMLIATNYSACKGWIGKYDGVPKEGGDCSHIKLGEGFMLESNKVYYGSSQFIHESLPLDRDVFRIMYRITLPAEHPPLFAE